MVTRLISKVIGQVTLCKGRHYVGLPPELTGTHDHRTLLGYPAFLTIQKAMSNSGWFLHRFNSDGSCVGDTWHIDLDDAKEQATE